MRHEYTHDELGLDPVAVYEAKGEHHSALAEQCQANGDLRGLGHALWACAWVQEKLGDGAAAIELAKEARVHLESTDDTSAAAECSHTIAVWIFHNLDRADSFTDFEVAIEAREALGELLPAAQSWHNMAYVQSMHGLAGEAALSYARASQLLRDAEESADPGVAASAFRQRGFVLSHLAYMYAHHGMPHEALDAALAYFEHVAASGHHREPVLAYLAAGVALASGDLSARPTRDALERTTGIPPEAERWLRGGMDYAYQALVSYAGGRRPYLGAHLRAMVETARWCQAHDRLAEAERLAGEAVARAQARGWAGEAARIRREVEVGDVSAY